jgi:ArsR family transcriptional regulator, virulence genes transcriptional regulator
MMPGSVRREPLGAACRPQEAPMDPIALQQNVGEAAQLMKALSNSHRLAILCQLLEGEKSVGQLVALIGLSQSALSQHLARLRRDRLVRTRRASQTIFYALDGAQVRIVLDTLHQLYCRDHASAGRETSLASATVAPRLLA